MQNEISIIGATRFAVGISQILRVMPSGYQYAETLQYVSGGSLEIVPPQLSGASTASHPGGTGKILGTTEVYSIGGPAVFYLAATGATAIASMTLGYTAGASVL